MKNPRSLRLTLALFVALIVSIPTAGTAASKKSSEKVGTNPTSPAIAGAKFVGSETCKGCHEEQFKTMQATPHYKTFGSTAGSEGCESCHGAGSAHVDAGGDKSKILRFAELKSDVSSKTCLACHAQKLEQQHFAGSVHNRAGVGCTTCHSVHHAKEQEHLLSSKQPEMCFTCHNETKADFMKPFRHRVSEGLVQCSDCHNVHGSTTDKQLRNTSSQEAVCFKCHSDLRGPFVFEHEPVKTDGCIACHSPHGSTNPRMLQTARVNSMCQQCHQNFYNGPHPQNTKSQACTLCHVAVHGSNTSNVLFKR